MPPTLDTAIFALLTVNLIFLGALGPQNVFTLPEKGMRWPIIAAFAATVILALWVVAASLLGWGPHEVAQDLTYVSMVCFSGLLLFGTRLKEPVLYGIIEVAAGVAGAVAVVFLQDENEVLVIVIGLAAAAYVIVRGLTNINDALKRSDDEALGAAQKVKAEVADDRADQDAEDAEADAAIAVAATFPRNSPEPTAPASAADGDK